MTGGSSRWELVALVGLLVVLAGIYAPGLAGLPTDWDDEIWLSDPVVIAGPIGGLPEALGTVRDTNWAPALRLSFATWTAVGGPTAIHAVQLALWLWIVGGTWWFLRRIGLGPWLVGGAVTAWALHPARVECVSWLTGLKDVQSGALLVGAALLATLPTSVAATAAVTACCALAAATKAATFPVTCVLWAVSAAIHGRSEALRRLGPGVAVAVAVALVGLAVWGADREPPPGPWWEHTLRVYGAFCAKLSPTVVPAALTPLPAPGQAAAAAAVVTGGMLVLASRDRRGWLLLLGWVLPLVPFLGVVHMAFWASDRHLLFASLAPALAAGLALADAAPWLAALGLLSLTTTVPRVHEWHDALTLWEAESHKPGDHWLRGHKLGTALGRAGRFAEAEAAFDRSLALRPNDGPTLARRLLASLAADGWTDADARAVPFLEPPPADERAWWRAAEAVRAAGRPDLAAMAMRQAEAVALGR